VLVHPLAPLRPLRITFIAPKSTDCKAILIVKVRGAGRLGPEPPERPDGARGDSIIVRF
jgi:hypothetical protein